MSEIRDDPSPPIPPPRRFPRWLLIAALVMAAGAGFAVYINRPTSGEGAKTAVAHQQWYCPMHPQVVSDKPGKCPICGMTLIPVPAAPAGGQP